MKKKEAYNKLMNTKVFVSNEATSKAVQEVYFKAGFTWAFKETFPKYTTKPFLYVNDKRLGYGDNVECFRKSSLVEYYPNEILNMEIEEDCFNNAEEFIEVAKKHSPFGLLYSNTCNEYAQILKITDSSVLISNGYTSYETLTRDYTFADGSSITK